LALVKRCFKQAFIVDDAAATEKAKAWTSLAGVQTVFLL